MWSLTISQWKWKEVDLRWIVERIVIAISLMGYWFVCCYQLTCLCTHIYDDSERSSSSRREKCVHRSFYWRTGSILSELKMTIWCSLNKPVKKLHIISLRFIFRCAWDWRLYGQNSKILLRQASRLYQTGCPFGREHVKENGLLIGRE